MCILIQGRTLQTYSYTWNWTIMEWDRNSYAVPHNCACWAMNTWRERVESIRYLKPANGRAARRGRSCPSSPRRRRAGRWRPNRSIEGCETYCSTATKHTNQIRNQLNGPDFPWLDCTSTLPYPLLKGGGRGLCQTRMGMKEDGDEDQPQREEREARRRNRWRRVRAIKTYFCYLGLWS